MEGRHLRRDWRRSVRPHRKVPSYEELTTASRLIPGQYHLNRRGITNFSEIKAEGQTPSWLWMAHKSGLSTLSFFHHLFRGRRLFENGGRKKIIRRWTQASIAPPRRSRTLIYCAITRKLGQLRTQARIKTAESGPKRRKAKERREKGAPWLSSHRQSPTTGLYQTFSRSVCLIWNSTVRAHLTPSQFTGPIAIGPRKSLVLTF